MLTEEGPITKATAKDLRDKVGSRIGHLLSIKKKEMLMKIMMLTAEQGPRGIKLITMFMLPEQMLCHWAKLEGLDQDQVRPTFQPITLEAKIPDPATFLQIMGMKILRGAVRTDAKVDVKTTVEVEAVIPVTPVVMTLGMEVATPTMAIADATTTLVVAEVVVVAVEAVEAMPHAIQDCQ